EGSVERVLPLMTTKSLPFDKIYGELLWFLGGSTNVKWLQEHGINIWNANSSREFLTANGFGEYPEGEVGPTYGFQWRNFGGAYTDREKSTDEYEFTRPGVDQIWRLIKGLKSDPTSRRHVVCAWNPQQLQYQVLPPCHIMQIYKVDFRDEVPYLSCHVIMRSADMFLVVPFNIASYATLTHMIAYLVGMHAGELALTMTDCHLYSNHVE